MTEKSGKAEEIADPVSEKRDADIDEVKEKPVALPPYIPGMHCIENTLVEIADPLLHVENADVLSDSLCLIVHGIDKEPGLTEMPPDLFHGIFILMVKL